MGVSVRICFENKVEMRALKVKAKRILKFHEDYPEMSAERRMLFTVRLNEVMERVEYLKRDKNCNKRREIGEDEEPDYSFHYVFKKQQVKNRKL